MTNDQNDSGAPEQSGEGDPVQKRPYVKPVLLYHGPLSGLTHAYLQGKGKGPPPGTKYVGSKDLSRSGQGV